MSRTSRALRICAMLTVVGALSACSVPGVSRAAPHHRIPRPSPSAAPTPELVAPTVPHADRSPAPAPEPPVGAGTDETATDDPRSLLVVVNKQRPLHPADHVPTDLVTADVPRANPSVLRAEAARALEHMFATAKAEGAGAMQVQSAYRSYATQVSVYDGWVRQLGQAGADRQSARPGYSEHQTGLSVDVSSLPSTCALQACFAETGQGRWLASNAWRFGFVLRYPAQQTPTTGYTYEPWHFRYIGPVPARKYHDTGATTLEAFAGLPAAPTY